jgi:hypothetical protein
MVNCVFDLQRKPHFVRLSRPKTYARAEDPEKEEDPEETEVDWQEIAVPRFSRECTQLLRDGLCEVIYFWPDDVYDG